MMNEKQPMDNVDYEVMLASAKKKGILMTLAVVLIGAVGLYFFGVFDGPAAVASSPAQATEGAVLDAGNFVVNLSDSKKQRYAKVSFALVLAEDVDPELAMERLPLVKDGIMPKLMGMNSQELATPEGFELVREELSQQARAMYPPGEVIRAVVTELIVQ